MRNLIVGSILLLAASGARAGTTDFYPLSTCIVSGDALDAHRSVMVTEHDGREIRFCGEGCATKFDADAETYAKKLDAAIVEDQLALYPLDVCVKSGGKLGNMGDPYDHVHGNRLVRFCCGGCVDGFEANAAELMKKLDEGVVAAQRESYPLEVCVQSGEALGGMGDPYEVVIGGRLVLLCCEGCMKGLAEDPAAAVARIDAAREVD